jgi:ABC-type Fe3+-hydroxamate transport system substrate-binding protein
MATYVNDLRLKEITTGDESGTWGTSTNTNLELIAEAFSFGTEAITTNADTHTTTVADGATDPGRSLYLKYTGTLDSACTITLGPNTISKVWIIENATSGSQNIIIKQGSGTTVTIANDAVKVVYSDGAGSGASVVDAFQDVALGGTPTATNMTITSSLTADGSITSATYFYSSDAALKEDIQTIENPLEKVQALRGVSYKWKDTGRKDIGLVADEVQEVLPELVVENEHKQMDYGHMIGLLVEAIKEQQKEIEELKCQK